MYTNHSQRFHSAYRKFKIYTYSEINQQLIKNLPLRPEHDLSPQVHLSIFSFSPHLHAAPHPSLHPHQQDDLKITNHISITNCLPFYSCFTLHFYFSPLPPFQFCSHQLSCLPQITSKTAVPTLSQ